MTTHNLKVWPDFFEAIIDGRKSFEIRKNDRNYTVGDALLLQECFNGKYTGRSIYKTVTYVLEDAESFGLIPGFCVMGLR